MQRGKNQGWVIAVALAALSLSAAGCGDDTAATPDAAVKKDSGPAEAPTPTAALCKANAKERMSVSPQPQIDCLCDKCLDLMAECDTLEGCVEIRDCSDRTGCVAQACYFNTPECMVIIDKWGTTGLATTLVQQLSDCSIAMNCQYEAPKPDAGTVVPADDAGSSDAGH